MQVEPGGDGRSQARTSGVGVGAVVAQDQVHGQALGYLAVDGARYDGRILDRQRKGEANTMTSEDEISVSHKLGYPLVMYSERWDGGAIGGPCSG